MFYSLYHKYRTISFSIALVLYLVSVINTAVTGGGLWFSLPCTVLFVVWIIGCKISNEEGNDGS